MPRPAGRSPATALLLALGLAALLVVGLATPGAASPLVPASGGRPAQCTSSDRDDCEGSLTVAPGADLHYYRNVALTGSPVVTHAVIAVHGDERNAWSSFTGVRDAAAQTGHGADTLVVSPSFKIDDDDPDDDEVRFADQQDWKDGGDAARPRGVSSFDMVDDLVRVLADRSRFPRLTRITVAGHSAGGQFTQRYAALGKAVGRTPGVTMDFAPANPSTFLYLTPERPDLTDTSGRRFRVPTTSCAYDRYKFGLVDRNRYARDTPAAAIVGQYVAQRVTYLQGALDTGTESLDTTCAARLQGTNRLERGRFYAAYVSSRFPSAHHRLVTVPGVGHDRRGMFVSPQGEAVLFGEPTDPGGRR